MLVGLSQGGKIYQLDSIRGHIAMALVVIFL